MIKDGIINFILSAVGSVIITILVVGLVIGENGIPTTVMANVLGNIPTAILSGGLSAFVTTIVIYKTKKTGN